jgi:glutaredoxin
MYSKPTCSFCTKAKKLLDEKMVPYEERVVGNGYSADQVREHCRKLDPNAVVTTVPQIILQIDTSEQYIGGYTELAVKVHSGTL